MDKIWDRNPAKSGSLAVMAGMKKLNCHAEPTKVEREFFYKVLQFFKMPAFRMSVFEKDGICSVWNVLGMTTVSFK